MSGFLALARLEVRQRRMVFLGAALLSVVPFAVPLSRSLRGVPAREARELTAFLLGAGFAAVLSLVLGWSIVSRDLSERRLGFFFARPLSGLSIWAGKMGAVLALAWAAAAVVWLPTLLASRGRTIRADLPGWLPWAVLAGSAACLLLSHAAAIALRSRTALLLVDAAVLLAATVATLWLIRILNLRAAMGPIRNGLIGIGVALFLGIAAAGLAAVARGRTDIRAAHRALSPWLWGSAGGAALVFAAYSGWVLSSTPRDLELVGAEPAPMGPWVAVDGRARGASAGFLLDTSTGAFRHAGAAQSSSWWQGPSFSGDGSTAAWFEATGDPEPFELVVASLHDGRALPRRTGYMNTRLPYDLTLSSEGSRAAILQSGTLTVVDLATGRSLGSARLSHVDFSAYGSFVGPDRFRACLWGTNRLEVLDYEIPSRRLTRLASIGDLQGWYSFGLRRDRERLLIREKGGARVRLFDVRSGEVLATLAEGESPKFSSWPVFLADGRIVYATSDAAETKLRVFSAEGSLQGTIGLPLAPRVFLGGEIASGKIVASTHPADAPGWEGSTLYLVDVDARNARRVAGDLAPLIWFPMWFDAPGSDGSKLFTGPHHSLVRFDPMTGERKTILAGRASR